MRNLAIRMLGIGVLIATDQLSPILGVAALATIFGYVIAPRTVRVR
jgi:hypothetical protein